MNNHLIEFNSKEYNDLLKAYRSNPSGKHMLVFAGNFNSNRRFAIDQFVTESNGDAVEIDLSNYITRFEEESKEKLDELFIELSAIHNGIILFRNAESLCGVYTGHTYSVVKYATPQEKYFLKKLEGIRVPSIVEFSNEDHLDSTISRKADAVVLFKVPTSLIEKLFWAISQVRVNGSNLPSRRPA